MEKKMNQTDVVELLKHNLTKVAEICAQAEKEDPIRVAYLAGRIDGISDRAWMNGRGA